MLQRFRTAVILTTAMLVVATVGAEAQRHAKREANIGESEKPQNVKGGATFQVGVPYSKSYEGALNYLKRQGYTIDSASSDTGQIITALDIKGGYTQTGTRVQVTCIKDNDTQTSVRVVVTEQKRKKLLQTEPWGDAKANEVESSKIADQIKTAIGN
jgi:hypothetical protein